MRTMALVVALVLFVSLAVPAPAEAFWEIALVAVLALVAIAAIFSAPKEEKAAKEEKKKVIRVDSEQILEK